MQQISDTKLEDILIKSNVNAIQKTVIKEIVSFSKSNLHGVRYDKEWILQFMLIHLKSPTTYEFIRNQKLLPLPCVRTIRRYKFGL